MIRFYFLFILFVTLQSCSSHFAKFSSPEQQITLPSKIKFENQSKDADRYEWNFGDGQTSSMASPEHLYTKSGVYTVQLKAFKGNKMSMHQQRIEVKPPEGCFVSIETPLGNMIVKLYDQTPLHRDNFFKLAEQGFYDGLIFHRVINGFMIQGGDPGSREAGPGTMLGSGGPNYTIPAEFNPKYVHKKGALAAARTGDQVNPKKASSGSQFYIVQGGIQNENGLIQMEDRKGIKYTDEQKSAYTSLGGTPFLDMEYTVFGEVIEGLEVIDKIAAVKTERGDRPTEDIRMKIKAIH